MTNVAQKSLDGMTIDRLTAALGCEVIGVDLSSVSDDQIRTIEELLVEHQVLFFPGQHLSIESHVELGRRFGPLEAHPNLKNPFTEHPELFELAASAGGIADEWHTDLTFLESPSMMSVLQMLTCPETGGDTMWTNLNMAYDELSPPIRDLLDGLTALHDASAHAKPEIQTVHPVVRIHPKSGRRALYVNEHFTRRIVELSHAESDLLLAYLTKWVHSERFTVRYRWSAGTIAMWDNRSTQHFVLNDFVGERIIQRVTVMGDNPQGNGRRWPRWSSEKSASSRHDWVLDRYFKNKS